MIDQKMEERLRHVENTIAAEFASIKTTIRSFGGFLSVLGTVFIFMFGIFGWEFNRIINYNDIIDDKQSQQIIEMRLDYNKRIDVISHRVDVLDILIKKE